MATVYKNKPFYFLKTTENARNMCWKKVNNLKTNSLVDLFILKYLLFSLIGQKKIIYFSSTCVSGIFCHLQEVKWFVLENSLYIYIYIHTHKRLSVQGLWHTQRHRHTHKQSIFHLIWKIFFFDLCHISYSRFQFVIVTNICFSVLFYAIHLLYSFFALFLACQVDKKRKLTFSLLTKPKDCQQSSTYTADLICNI